MEGTIYARQTQRRRRVQCTKRQARLLRRHRRGYKLGNDGHPTGAEYQAVMARRARRSGL